MEATGDLLPTAVGEVTLPREAGVSVEEAVDGEGLRLVTAEAEVVAEATGAISAVSCCPTACLAGNKTLAVNRGVS